MSAKMLFAVMRVLEALKTDLKLYNEEKGGLLNAIDYVNEAILAIDQELSCKYNT